MYFWNIYVEYVYWDKLCCIGSYSSNTFKNLGIFKKKVKSLFSYSYRRKHIWNKTDACMFLQKFNQNNTKIDITGSAPA